MADLPKDDHTRFRTVGFEDFRAMAKDENLSKFQKIGFPDMYRADKERLILNDITAKLPALASKKSIILDIGPGCSDLPHYMIENARELSQQLILIDSAEMLDQLPDQTGSHKIAAMYPDDCPDLFTDYQQKLDAILVYSVMQYVFAEGNIFNFIDKSLSLLAPGGRMLIGDIPNASMRKRFFASAAGVKSHREFTGKDEDPVVVFNTIEPATMDDAAVLAIVSRARLAGFHAYIIPQAPELPMANRREDILIVKP